MTGNNTESCQTFQRTSTSMIASDNQRNRG